jgi:hypothetical protein
MPKPFIWKDREVVTIGDLTDAMFAIRDKGRATRFMNAYRSVNEHADANVGYVLGYIEPPEKRHQMYDLFRVEHPVFGGRP